MIAFVTLVQEVETMRSDKSNAYKYIGRNVRPSSLVKGKTYIVRNRTTSHQANYDNPFHVVKFVGCGTNETGPFEDKNYTVKEMVYGQYYYFEGYDQSRNETYVYGAYESNGSLSIGSGATGVSFYDVVEEVGEEVAA